MTNESILTNGTRTFLFTDLVGSTALRSSVGDRVADELRRTHDALLRDAVSASNGHVVKGTGDGLHVVFGSAADAVGCAIAMQQSIARYSARAAVELRLRIGLSVGDVVCEEGDFFGMPVIEAARLEAAAEPNQILAADLVRVLAGSRTDAIFSPVGALTLKGLPEPLPACDVAWEPEFTDSSVSAALRVSDGAPFFGRDDELAWLDSLWRRAVGGERTIALIGGDRGIGKSRLVAELAEQVQRLGSRVLYGGAGPHTTTSAEPLVDALLGYVSTANAADLRIEVGDDGEQLSRLVPLLADRLRGFPGVAADTEQDSDTEVEVVARFLSRVAEAAPLLLVLDDLDRAGDRTLHALHHLAASSAPAPMLVVACYRDRKDGLPQRLVNLIGEVDRIARVDSRTLHALDETAVAALLASRTDPRLSDELVAAVHDETGGNPELVLRAARTLREQHVAQRMTDSVTRVEAARGDLQQVREMIVNDVLELQRLRMAPSDDASPIGAPIDPEGTPPARVLCPYKGLVRFEADDAEWFCGRERLVADLVARLVSARMVGVVGASGSGKSSLVRAGLLPALRADALPASGNWREVVMTPGPQPLQELARVVSPLGRGVQSDEMLRRLEAAPGALDALARQAVEDRDDARLVLVVDQFEEVFTSCRSEHTRRRFIDELLHASGCAGGPTLVVVVLRADYYGRCAEHEQLAAQLSEAQLLVGPMSEIELRRAIDEPARRAGLVLEPGLVETLLRDVGAEPASLPLLSTALLETWERRRGRTLSLVGYAETGGVRGAVARLAEGVWEYLDPAQRAAARRIFLCLAEPGEGRDDVRRRAPLEELLGGDQTSDAVLHILVARRLVVTDDTTAEVAHEALLREWPRLRDWLEEDREGRRLQRHLAQAADEWVAAGREPEQLFRGGRLQAATEWADAHSADLRTPDLEFIVAGRTQQNAEQVRVRRRARRLRILAGGLAALLVLSILGGVAALGQRNRADATARRADRAANTAFAERLSAQARALGTDQLDLSLLLAAQARRLTQSNATNGGLEAALAHVPPGYAHSARIPPTAGGVVASPNGQVLAFPGLDGKIHLLDHNWAPLSESTGTLEAKSFQGKPATGVAFSADSTRVLAIGHGTVMVWDVRSGTPVAPPLERGGTVAAAFDRADSDRLFVAAVVRDEGGYARGTVEHWDLVPGPVAKKIAPRFSTWDFGRHRYSDVADGSPLLLNVSADGRRVAVGVPVASATSVWDTRSGAQVQSRIGGVAGGFTPAGLLMLVRDERVVLVDPETAEENGPSLTGFRQPNPAIVVRADGRLIAVSDLVDSSIRVFDLAHRDNNGRAPQVGFTLSVFSSPSFPVVFRGDRLVTADSDRLIDWRFTDLAPALVTLLPMENDAGHVSPQFTPDGADVITVAWDTQVAWRWKADDGRSRGRFLAQARPSSRVGISPDGESVVANRADGTAGLYDIASGKQLALLDDGQEHVKHPIAVAWSPAGEVVATASADLSLVLWDVSDRHRPRVLKRLAPRTALSQPLFPFFSRDGRHVLTTNPLVARTATMYDIPSGRQLWSYGPIGIGAAFSPDGATVAIGLPSAGPAGDIGLFDTVLGPNSLRRLPQSQPNQGFEFAGARGEWLAIARHPTGGDPRGRTLGINTLSVVLYDTETSQQVGEPINLLSGSLGFDWAISPDGTRFATGVQNSPGGSAAIWDLDPDRWATTACRIAGRNLSREEWRHYLGNRPYQQTCSQGRADA